MSLSRDHYISIQLSRKTDISQLLEGWKYWLDLGLISEQGVSAKLVGGNDSLQVNFQTTLTITNLIQQLQLLQEVDAFAGETTITFSIKISASDPLLLQGLDRWVKLELLNSHQVKSIAQKDLSCPIRVIFSPILSPVNEPLTPSLSTVPSQNLPIRKKRKKTARIAQIGQSLMAELSVIWLLLLGVFMVVVSSGVIAASWWQKFPAVLQYGILWLYTLGFGLASWWTGKQPNLRLTTQGLRIVALLLVPINFLAMDSFPLWHTFLGLIGMLVGSLSLTLLTVNLFKDKNQSSSTSLPLLNHLGLTYLHWGWSLPGIPLFFTYIGVIGTTIITLVSPQNTQNSKKKLLPFSLTEAIIIYALVILLVRAIFLAQVNVFQLSLAIGLCGWLMGWRSPPKTPWKWIGSGLLTVGWLLSVFVIPSQAIAVSLLAIVWLGRRLKTSGLRRDIFIIFLMGLQINWLLIRLPIVQPIWTNIIDFTNTNNYPFVLSSVALIPYLLAMVLGRHFLLKMDQVKLYNYSGKLLFFFGFILTIISFINPLIRTINLIFSTLTLAYETRHKLKQNRRVFLKPLALITHVSLLLTLTSGINYYFPQLSINSWALILLGFMTVELAVSLVQFSEQSLIQLVNNYSWIMGIFFAILSYGLLWFKLPANLPFWGVSWLIVPSLLTAIATWYLPRRKLGSELSVIAICLLQALTIYFPETRLIGLVMGTILMIINTQYLRHLYSVIITIGLGITAIIFYLYILDLSSSLWVLSGVVITLLLWFIRHVFCENTSELSLMYAQCFDGYAYLLSFISLIRLIDVSLVYTSATNTLIASLILMGSVAYRSWQPYIVNNRFPLLYSILVLAIVPLPALSLPLWGWIELGVATLLMMVQTQIFKQVNIAFITIGFILEFMVVVLEDNGLKYAEQFWVYWLLIAAIIPILFWIIYHIFNYFQIQYIDYYKKALNLWGITLCTLSVIIISLGRLTTDYLLNNDLVLLITINLIMVGSAYRSWQKPRQNGLIWFSIIIILMLQVSNPNISITNIITPVIGTILLCINSYLFPQFSTAFITIGMGIFCRSLIVLEMAEVLTLPKIPVWILTDSITLITLWLIWNYLKDKTQLLATIYVKVIDVWGIILCSFLLVTLTLHSIAIYWEYTNPSFTVITAISVLFLAIFYRTRKQPNNLMFYTLGWTLELLTINITTKFSQSLIILGVVNIILGILFQLIGNWWQRKTGERQFLSGLHIIPLLYGALGTALRYNSFNSLTGLTSLGFGLIIIGFVRQKRSLKPLIYLGIALISFSSYELLFYQITNFSWVDKYLSMAALATTIMYVYRLASPWLSSYLYLTLRGLKIIAHLHWILGSIFLGLSLLYPVTSQQLIGLSVGLFLTQYAILEGRNLDDKRKGEIWVYLGFIEAGITAIYGFFIFPSTFLSNVIGAILSLLSIVIYTLPWRQWGWSKTPWNLLAFTLPLMGIISTFNPLTLLLASISYAILSKLSNRSRLFYPSLLLINTAAYNSMSELQQLSPLLSSGLLCFSLLLMITIEPYCQGENQKPIRHSLRLIATVILGTVSFIFYKDIGFISGLVGLIFIAIGLGLKIRAFLFTGTITFLITVFYQLVIFSFNYPLSKWIIGLLLGLMFIWIAASFENRRTQINTIINHWIEEFSTWE